eukprot:6228107-Amphidinium_carterae.2
MRIRWDVPEYASIASFGVIASQLCDRVNDAILTFCCAKPFENKRVPTSRSLLCVCAAWHVDRPMHSYVSLQSHWKAQ